jgi:hypothetical protein
MLLVFESEEMKENQSQPKKKRHEAAQHPRSEAERIVCSRVKANKVESQREGDSKRGDEYPPAQKSFAGFHLGATQSPFGKGNGFPVIHITQEGKEAKNDQEDAYDTDTRYKI